MRGAIALPQRGVVAPDAADRLRWSAVFAGLGLSALVFPLLLLAFVAWDAGIPRDAWQVEQMLALLAIVGAVTAMHALLIGLPMFLLLRRAGRLSAITLSMVGFFAGTLLMGVAGWPWRGGTPGSSYSTNWHGRFVEMEKDGVPTLYGWLSWMESTAIFGLAGIASALAFWYGWRYFQRRAQGPAATGHSRH